MREGFPRDEQAPLRRRRGPIPAGSGVQPRESPGSPPALSPPGAEPPRPRFGITTTRKKKGISPEISVSRRSRAAARFTSGGDGSGAALRLPPPAEFGDAPGGHGARRADGGHARAEPRAAPAPSGPGRGHRASHASTLTLTTGAAVGAARPKNRRDLKKTRREAGRGAGLGRPPWCPRAEERGSRGGHTRDAPITTSCRRAGWG